MDIYHYTRGLGTEFLHDVYPQTIWALDSARSVLWAFFFLRPTAFRSQSTSLLRLSSRFHDGHENRVHGPSARYSRSAIEPIDPVL